MRLKKEDKLNKMLNEVDEKLSIAVSNMADELSFKIEATYEKVISAFYADYTPIEYDRTYSTFLGSNAYDNPFFINESENTENSKIAGILVGSDFIPGNPYKANKDWVFDRTFISGIHGVNVHTVRHRNTTLFKKDQQRRLLAAYFNKLNKNQKKLRLRTKGVIPLQETLGSILVHNTNIPTNMNPPPKKIMDKEFKKLIKKKNLDKMFNDQIKALIDKKH